jgi:rRNA-processing protein FCF1
VATDRRGDPEGLTRTGPSAAVILDSNFLFIPLRFGVDIFEELHRLLGRNVRCVVTMPIIDELRLLRTDAKPSFRKEVDFALGLVDRCEVMEASLGPGEAVDDSIVRVASDGPFIVATNDAELRRRLRKAGVSVVFLRQRNHLEIEGITE